MSTPPFLTLPTCASRLTLEGRIGPLAGLRADPRAAGWQDPVPGDLLLVPGFTGSKEDFIAVLAPLARAGWRVTTYDQRGQYESAGPDDPAAYTLAGFASDVRAVAATLPGPVHLVGHSFGGLVAREAALAEGPHGLFASLLLLCSGPGPIKVEDHVGLQLLRDRLPGTDLGLLYDLTHEYTGTRAPAGAVGAFLRRRYVANNPTGLGAIAGLLLTAPDRTAALATLATAGLRVAVAYGSADDAWPLDQQDTVAAACGTSAHVIVGAGHSPAADSPAATAALLATVAAGAAGAGQVARSPRAAHPGAAGNDAC